jgi:hypothetical protein
MDRGRKIANLPLLSQGKQEKEVIEVMWNGD